MPAVAELHADIYAQPVRRRPLCAAWSPEKPTVHHRGVGVTGYWYRRQHGSLQPNGPSAFAVATDKGSRATGSVSRTRTSARECEHQLRRRSDVFLSYVSRVPRWESGVQQCNGEISNQLQHELARSDRADLWRP